MNNVNNTAQDTLPIFPLSPIYPFYVPVSVSHNLMCLSNDALINFVPSFVKQMSFTLLLCPMYVRMHALSWYICQICANHNTA